MYKNITQIFRVIFHCLYEVIFIFKDIIKNSNSSLKTTSVFQNIVLYDLYIPFNMGSKHLSFFYFVWNITKTWFFNASTVYSATKIVHAIYSRRSGKRVMWYQSKTVPLFQLLDEMSNRWHCLDKEWYNRACLFSLFHREVRPNKELLSHYQFFLIDDYLFENASIANYICWIRFILKLPDSQLLSSFRLIRILFYIS